jgi:hypothetical protein
MMAQSQLPHTQHPQQAPHVRERITFPSASSANMDHDWDIPTFQRRGGG